MVHEHILRHKDDIDVDPISYKERMKQSIDEFVFRNDKFIYFMYSVNFDSKGKMTITKVSGGNCCLPDSAVIFLEMLLDLKKQIKQTIEMIEQYDNENDKDKM